MLGAVDAHRQARDALALSRTDGEARDVVAAPREHLRHARKRPRLVLHLDTHPVVAHPVILSCSNSSSGLSITSTRPAPAATIGERFPAGPTRARPAAVRPRA